MENNRSATFTLSRRIGSTRYTVNARCSDKAAETFEEKIIRLIRNDTMETGAKCGIMGLPQTSRQSERNASAVTMTSLAIRVPL